jgi:hypothetical protein
MALINFKLKHPDEILPWGVDDDNSIYWSDLTYGEYWLDVKKAKLYEYTEEVTKSGDSRYVEYQIFRLITDLTGIFESVAEPVPDAFYAIAKEHNYLYRFYSAVQQKLSSEEDDKAVEWIYSRTLMAEHLTSGPGISFFRNGDHLAIVWNADYVTENNIPIWTAQNGQVEMGYNTFVQEVEDFGKRFFDAMDVQVQLASKANKERLLQEQLKRKAEFQKKLAILKSEPAKNTDWEQVNAIVTKMFS